MRWGSQSRGTLQKLNEKVAERILRHYATTQNLSAFLAIESIKFFRNLIYLDLLRGQEQVSGRRDIQCHYKKRNSFYRIKVFWIM